MHQGFKGHFIILIVNIDVLVTHGFMKIDVVYSFNVYFINVFYCPNNCY